MRREIDIYDPIEDKQIQKKEMSPKTKKALIYILCAIIGVAVAAVIMLVLDLMFTGAATPEQAIKEYETAAIIYDADGMIEYSSPYNKVVLYGNRETSDRLLKAYLEKAYSEYEAKYNESQISFRLISSLEYEKGSRRYEEAMEKYEQKVENGSAEIDSVAIVKMTVVKGTDETTREYLAVKIDGRWFFAYAGV
jgi:hypothetical protein